MNPVSTPTNKVLLLHTTSHLIEKLKHIVLDHSTTLSGKRNDTSEIIYAFQFKVDIGIGVRNVFHQLKEGGISVLLIAFQQFQHDITLVKAFFHLFSSMISKCRVIYSQDPTKQIATIIHMKGGKELIDDVFTRYENDEDVRFMGRFLLKELVLSGSWAAHVELVKIEKAIDWGISHDKMQAIHEAYSKTLKVERADDTIDQWSMINKEIPGENAIYLCCKHMETYAQNELIQETGMNIFLQATKNGSLLGLILRDEDDSMDVFFRLVVAAISTLSFSDEIRWRAHLTMMELTSNVHVCIPFMHQGGCDALMNALKNDCGNPSIQQFALWTLSNLCKEDLCLQKLIGLRLKPFLHDLLKSANGGKEAILRKAVIPYDLRHLFVASDLEFSKRFSLIDAAPPLMKRNIRISLRDLPKQKSARHGTVTDLFQDGDYGLV